MSILPVQITHPLYELFAKGISIYFGGGKVTIINQLAALGYSIDREFNDPITSFQALGLIYKDNTRPPVLIFQGTSDNIDSVEDSNPKGVGFNQFTANQEVVKNWLVTIIADKAKNPSGFKVDFTGHSLGGALTQWFASEYPNLLNEAISFQSPGVSQAASENFISKGGIPNQIIHYVVNGDFTSLAGEAFLTGTLRLADYQTSIYDPEQYQSKHSASILSDNLLGLTLTPNVDQLLATTLEQINAPTFTFTGQDWQEFIARVKAGNPDLAKTVESRANAEIARVAVGSYYNLIASINQAINTTTVNHLTRNDFNGDRKSDILWRNNDGSIATWQMNSLTATPKSIGAITSDWTIAGTGDFNGDQNADILFSHTNGSIATWQMNGSDVTQASTIGTLTSGWKVAGTGDLDGDGKTDILFQNTNGTVAAWQMNGSNVTATSVVGAATPDWQVAGTDDFNGDGKADILLRNTDGSIALWQMNGPTVSVASVIGAVTPNWTIAGTGDFNGDGKADILFRNTNGSVAEWQMNGAAVTSTSTLGSSTSDWQITGTGDFNGDGKADILWRNDLGSVATWQLDGNTILSAGLTSIPTADPAWKISD